MFIVIAAFFATLYFALIHVLKKSMDSHPTPNVSQATETWRNQSDKTADLQAQQRELMRQRQDHMRDLGHH